MEEKFEKIYNEILKLSIDELESLKWKTQKEKNTPLVTLATSIILGLIISVVMIILHNNGLVSSLGVRIVSIILLGIICISAGCLVAEQTEYKTYHQYRKIFKQKIIKPMFESLNENLRYYPDASIGIIEHSEFRAEKYDGFYSEDILVGNIGNLKVKIGEVLTQEEFYDRDRNKSEKKIFEGLFATIEIPKKFETELYIRKQFQQDLKDMKIEMDSGEFDDLFYVYSSDKIKTFELLTSDFMEFLVDYRKKIKIEFDITIKNNFIYMRFHTGEIKYQSGMSYRIHAGSMFEPPETDKEIIDKENLYHDYAIFYVCLQMINKIATKIVNAI